MSIQMKKLVYRNLKYVGEEGEQIQLSKGLTLLDGPNGYGKSTVYDAIELLLTGKIEHSNKGKISSVANNCNADIVIKAFLEGENVQVELGRTIIAADGFEKDNIVWNGEKISQEQLYDRLHINKSAMSVAIYVSQLKSLSYLEKGEKDRKKVVADLVDDSRFKEEVKCLEIFKKKLEEKLTQEKDNLKGKIVKENETKGKLTVQINNINKVQGKKEYSRLFEAKEYEFDKEHLDKNIGYSEMVKPLEDIKEFLQNYDSFNKTKRYFIIEKVLKLSQAQLKAFYYSKMIQKIKENSKLFEDIEKLEILLEQKNAEDIGQINQILSVPEDEQKWIERLIERYKILKNTEKGNEKYIFELIEKRKQLFQTYQKGIADVLWLKNACPFCGRDTEDLQTLFQNTEDAIKENNKLVVDDIQQIDVFINQYFEKRLNELELLIRENGEEYSKYKEMKELLQLGIKSDEKSVLLEKHFEYSAAKNSDFEEDVILLKKELEEEKRKIEGILEKEVVARYENIVQKYYAEKEFHTVGQIDDKLAYIADYYSDDYQNELSLCDDRLRELNKELEQKEKTKEHMLQYTDTYIDKYKQALKEYQTNLVQQIKIPLYVYSGKVIQNYPMGLGVIANIKASSIVFETEKKEEDVFDYLSAGQLNGVMLSVMLAVRSVMNFKESLNIIMIDDPLQTIDDVSAFSYADLLSEQFGDAQIVLSTHEADKSDLLEFKFRQHERMVAKYNMHDRYLGSR